MISQSDASACGVDDMYETPVNTTLNVPASGILANDGMGFGSPFIVFSASITVHGMLNVYPSGAFSYYPEPGFVGVDTFNYYVTCRTGQGLIRSNWATVSITVRWVAPPVACSATDDAFTTDQDTAFFIADPGVLNNDLGTDAITSLGMSPTHGLMRLGADGAFIYVPETGYVGTDSFTYAISCSDGSSAVGTVTIDILGMSIPDATPIVEN